MFDTIVLLYFFVFLPFLYCIATKQLARTTDIFPEVVMGIVLTIFGGVLSILVISTFLTENAIIIMIITGLSIKMNLVHGLKYLMVEKAVEDWRNLPRYDIESLVLISFSSLVGTTILLGVLLFDKCNLKLIRFDKFVDKILLKEED